MRGRLIALVLFACCPAAPAGAAISDPFVPVKDAGDGVRLLRSDPGDQFFVQFGPKADRLYARELAGRRVRVSCADLTPQALGGGSFVTSGSTSVYRAPKRRAALTTDEGDGGTDLCAVSTKRGRGDRCISDDLGAKRWCVRVVVARTATGRTRVDEVGRAVDVSIALAAVFAAAEGEGAPAFADVERYLGDEVVELPARDAAPPRGVVGYWTDGEAMLVASVTRAGVRRFISFDGDVYSTNLPDQYGPQDVALF
jgi:hypothetical protein